MMSISFGVCATEKLLRLATAATELRASDCAVMRCSCLHRTLAPSATATLHSTSSASTHCWRPCALAVCTTHGGGGGRARCRRGPRAVAALLARPSGRGRSRRRGPPPRLLGPQAAAARGAPARSRYCVALTCHNQRDIDSSAAPSERPQRYFYQRSAV